MRPRSPRSPGLRTSTRPRTWTVAPALTRRGPLGLDVQGFVRVIRGIALVTAVWPEMAAVLRNVTYVKLDDAEAEVLVGETDLRRAAQAMTAVGPREVVLTHAHGLVVRAGGTGYEG